MLADSRQPLVLIVDDTPANIQILAETLRGDYRIKVATSGQAALDIVGQKGPDGQEADPPDLILLDVMMPEMDGYEVCRRLQLDPVTRAIPVIFVTARSDAVDEEHGLALGAMDYISKPIQPAIVKARVRNHLRLRLSQQQNELLAGAVRVSSMPFVVEHPDGRLRSANAAFERLTGHRGEELSGSDWAAQLTPAEWLPGEREKLAELHRSGRPVRYEKELIRRDGSRVAVDVLTYFAGGTDGTLGYRFSFLTDISERKRAELALQEREAQLQLFVEHAPAAIAMFDAQLRYLAVSRRWLADFGLAGEDVIGRGLYAVSPDLSGHWREVHRRCLAGANERADAELFERADGAQQWLRWEVRPWRTAAGAVGGLLVFAEDITELNQQRLDLARAKLQAEAARAEAERANAAKSYFLAAASHDLRQPLHALDIYLRLVAASVPPDCAGLVDKMKLCSDDLTALLNDLLDLSKLDAGAVKPQSSVFSLADFLDQIATLHEPSAQQKGLLFRVAPTRLAAATDSQLLRQLVANFVTNAIRYTERGGVLIGVRRRGGKLWIEVWDSGIGIADAQHEEIFEPFRQLGNPARDREHGAGLGLALVERLARLLGLQIRVASRPGRGSLFAIEVPRGELAADPAAAAAAQPVRQSLRVALIEDQAFVREAMVAGLQHLGHVVIAAADVVELLAGLDGAAPDIVVTDHRLKGGSSGSDAVAVVRQRYGEQVGAIVITGETDPGVVRSIVERGLRVLHKPVRLDALQASFDELAAGSRTQAA